MAEREEVTQNEGYAIRVVGRRSVSFSDLYHLLLRIPGWATLALIVGAYLALNVLFALLYLLSGGIANAQAGSFADAFFFSVQTLGTIGYGAMYPASRLANLLVVAESVLGLLLMAVATGLVFARFAQLRSRINFSARAVVGPMEGRPALCMRVGNERRGRAVAVHFHLTLVRSVPAADGTLLYRTLELPLLRTRVPSLQRAWMVVHPIDARSPLRGETAASFEAAEGELTLEVSAVDETTGQAIHALKTWVSPSVVWGGRFADLMSLDARGDLVIDLRRFDEVAPAAIPAVPE